MKKLFLSLSALSVIFFAVTAFRPYSPSIASDLSRPISGNDATKWEIDKAHSNVKFSVTHMLISQVEGNFKDFNGAVEHSQADFSDAKINFTIEVASVDTDNEKRDGHLKSPDFFDAAKYPQMTFVSTSFRPLGDNKYELNGNLTIKDVTKPVKFDVTYGGNVTSQGKVRAGFKAKTSINRFDYNLKWSAATETGGLVASKEVEITINAEFTQVK